MRKIDQSQFNVIKAGLQKCESAVKEVKVSHISVDGDSLRRGQIFIGSTAVKVAPSFFPRLGSWLRLNTVLTRKMFKDGDHQLAAVLINGLKDYAANRRIDTVLLIANVESKQVIDICEPKRYRRVTNSTLFDVTERLLNDHPGLIIETVDSDPKTGELSINLLNQHEIGFAQAGKDEFFRFGFSIVQRSKDTIVESYNQRLVCNNGLRVSFGSGAIGGNSDIGFEDRFRLDGTSAEDMRHFLNRIDQMRKKDFVPAGFEHSIQKAVATRASLSEVERAMKLATGKVNESDPNLKEMLKGSMIDQYFDGYNPTITRIIGKGKDPKDIFDRQKQFIKTDQSVWDVVNSLTFLGSNESGFNIHNRHELKAEAGLLFAKGVQSGFDLEFSQYANL